MSIEKRTYQKKREKEKVDDDYIKPEDISAIKFISNYIQASDIPLILEKKERDLQIIEWLKEYHNKETPPTIERKQYLRDAVIYNTFFLLPYILSKKQFNPTLFEDIIQMIVINLLKAIDNYNPEKGSKFSSYISGYIKDGIKLTIHNEQIITVPLHKKIQANKRKENEADTNLKNARIENKDAPKKRGRKPIKDFIPEVIMYEDNSDNFDSIEYAANLHGRYGNDEDLVTEDTSDEDIDKNEPVKTNASSNYVPLLPYDEVITKKADDSTDLKPEDKTYYNKLISILEYVLSDKCDVLNEKEKLVVGFHFGVLGNPQMTLSDIAKVLKSQGYEVSKPRISQISKKGVQKLKQYFSTLNLDLPNNFM